MKLHHVKISHFRNIATASVDLEKKTCAMVGKNAQGKTNLLEAIYFLACGKSFRNAKFRELIQDGVDRSEIEVEISDTGLPFSLKAVLDRHEGKSFYKNGVRLEKLSEFLGLFRVVLFCPEHLSLIKDGPARRRSFLDGAICQIRPYFASLLNEGAKIEAQRAALLKRSRTEKIPTELFEVWEERLARVSVKIAAIRAEYCRQLAQLAPVHYQRIAPEETLQIAYSGDVYQPDKSPEEREKLFREELRRNFLSDQKCGFSQKGVHRDDLILKIDGRPARGFASQGQQRSAVLSLKLAEGEISRAMTGAEPIYLLDDVLSELDEKRRAYITAGLGAKQVILTGTDRENFSFVEEILTVSGGCFSR